MHISCPRCDKTINAKNYNLFQIWECPKCEWRFRGVHAGQPVCLNYLFEYIAPLYHGPHINDASDCPYCGTLIDLNWIWEKMSGRSFGPFRKKGYDGPYVCKACCRDLPWDYPQQKKHVAKAYEKWAYEHNKKHGFDTSCFEEEGKKQEEKPEIISKEKQDRIADAVADLFRKKKNI